MSMPSEAKARKEVPLATGAVDYFPDALAAVAAVSKTGNDQHNPGQPLHWDRSKSTDEADALMRHFVDRGKLDKDGHRHSAKVAWRALALLQKELEAVGQDKVAEALGCPEIVGYIRHIPSGHYWVRPGFGMCEDKVQAHLYKQSEALAEIASERSGVLEFIPWTYELVVEPPKVATQPRKYCQTCEMFSDDPYFIKYGCPTDELFTEWLGGEYPPCAGNKLVDVLFRNDKNPYPKLAADTLDWEHKSLCSASDIVAWRFSV